MTSELDRAAMDLPPDNVSRLAIYDAVHELLDSNGVPAVTEDELFERVIGRLRLLVPRELYLQGERQYVEEKLAACAADGLVAIGTAGGRRLLSLTGKAPLVRYPDGQLHAYTPGLEPARERLDRDNARLRDAGFDVCRCVPSTADEPDGPAFQSLLASMREHGYLKQFPLVRTEDGVVVDGRARLRAAVVLDLPVEYVKYRSEPERRIARRRDTPLNRVLIALNANSGRLSPETVDAVHEQVAAVTRRSWAETASDLALTAKWRHAVAPVLEVRFEVRRLPFREGEVAKIQVTDDDKVMVRSLLESAGLAPYRIRTQLQRYVPIEQASTAHSSGRKADFARAEDLISGIAAMQQDRRAAKRKVHVEWEQVHDWLVRTFRPAEG